jgi:hypothetical protein
LKNPLSDRTPLWLRIFARSAVFAVLLSSGAARAQNSPPSSAANHDELADSVRQLREQVNDLRAAVAEIKAEASQYREESEELRKQLQRLQAAPAGPAATAATAEPSPSGSLEHRVAAVEENTQLLESQLRTQYQTKVESASKYRVRLSGLVLLNLFHNHGAVDNLDFPTYAIPSSYGESASFGATLRQSEFGLEVFGPELAGAKTSGQVQMDFGGGFPLGQIDGINTGLVRLRTAHARLDWDHTSIVAGQDNLFISPGSPASFASLAVPSFAYAGNLWSWTPQLRIEQRFDVAKDQNLILQAAILDNVTGQPTYSSQRQAQAGERSGQPAYAGRVGWNGALGDGTASFGVSGYYSPQNWGFNRKVNGWAVSGDWRLPISRHLEYSGEVFRGLAIGGIGGAIGQSVVFSGNPDVPTTQFRGLNGVGGWSQIKFLATPRLEFNGVFGLDEPFDTDLRAFPNPVGTYPVVFAANRSEMMNLIFRPRSNLLFSGEYRHLRTSQLSSYNTADQINLIMGVLF